MKTRFKHLIIALWLLAVPASAVAQLRYVGLKEESNITEALEALDIRWEQYLIRMQMEDGYLYLPTRHGLYRKDLSSLNNIRWELHAFRDIPVKNIVVNGNSLLAGTSEMSTDKLLLLSTDNGATYSDLTTPALWWDDEEYPQTLLEFLVPNPKNSNSVWAVASDKYAATTDFGATWEYQTKPGAVMHRYHYVAINPNDTTNYIIAGQTGYWRPFISVSNDCGATWTSSQLAGAESTFNTILGIAFHPTDKNRMMYYGSDCFAKSTDQGKTWSEWRSFPVAMLIYKVIYDPEEPNVLYASGDSSDDLIVLRSTDGGESWHVFYKEYIPDSRGVHDLILHDGKLFVYTAQAGVFCLDLMSVPQLNDIFLDYPATQIIDDYLYIPTKDGIYRKDLSSKANLDWEPYAFAGVPVWTFIKQNDTIVAATTNTTENMLLVSFDNGKTYTDYTLPLFLDKQYATGYINALIQNPIDTKSIIVLHPGMNDSTASAFGFDWRFMGSQYDRDKIMMLNPNDTTNLFSFSWGMLLNYELTVSYDNGVNWIYPTFYQEDIINPDKIAFHPHNKDILICSGSGRYGTILKSIDQGSTWHIVRKSLVIENISESDYEWYSKIVFDPVNPNIVYGAARINGIDNVRIVRSLDGGETWHIIYEEEIAGSSGARDMHIYKDQLVIYTYSQGVFFLDLKSFTDIDSPTLASRLTVYPNPATTEVSVRSHSIIREATLYNMQGQLLKRIYPDQAEVTIEVSALPAGMYMVRITDDNGKQESTLLRKK